METVRPWTDHPKQDNVIQQLLTIMSRPDFQCGHQHSDIEQLCREFLRTGEDLLTPGMAFRPLDDIRHTGTAVRDEVLNGLIIRIPCAPLRTCMHLKSWALPRS